MIVTLNILVCSYTHNILLYTCNCSPNRVQFRGRVKQASCLSIYVDPGVKIILSIKALEVMDHGGTKVRIIDSIGPLWEEVAKAVDIGQETIDMIKTKHLDSYVEACHEMLTTWLEGDNGEVSWTALTQALIDAGLPEVATSLKDILQKLHNDII